MKILILKYRQLNVKKPISIYDTAGSLKFEVTQEFPEKLISTKTIFKLADAEGKTLLTLLSEGISQAPSLKYSIIENNVKIGEVLGKKLFAHSEFNMRLSSEEYKLYGVKKFLFFSEVGF